MAGLLRHFKPEHHRPWPVILPAAAGLTLSAAVFGWFFDLPQVPVIAVLLLAGAWILRGRSFAAGRRTLGYAALASLVLAAVGNSVFPFEVNRFGIFSMIFQAEYTTPLMIYFACMLTAFWYPRLIAGGALAAIFLTLCSIGDVASFGEDNQRLPWDGVWVEQHYALLYGLTAVTLFLLGLIAVAAVEFSNRRLEGTSRLGMWTVRLVLLLAVLPAGWFGAWRLHQNYEREIRQFENNFTMNMASRWFRGRQSGQSEYFPVDSNLWRAFPGGADGADLGRILIRAEGDVPPGYLRTQAYIHYENGMWKGHRAGEAGPPPPWEPAAVGESTLTFRRSDLPVTAESPSWRFYWNSGFQSRELPLPGDAALVELIAASLDAGADGQVAAPDWLRAGGYRAAASDAGYDGRAALSWPAEPGEAYRQVPEELYGVLDAFLAGIPGLAQASDDRTRQALIAAYLAENFTYELGTAAPRQEPVAWFLTERRAGHCELFASAAVLLARRLGMPARYVTGLVCAEEHPSGSYYVARSGNIHAWAEVFDRDSGQWRLLEATPPGALPDFSGEWNFASSLWDRLKHGAGQLMGALRRGEFAAAARLLLFNPVTLVLAAAVIFWRWRRHRQRRRARGPELPGDLARWAEQARRREAKWIRRGRLKLAPGHTFRDTVRAVTASPAFDAEEKRQAQAFADEYYRMRFGKTEER